MYLKNDSSPNAIYAILVNASDGSPITSGVTAYHIQGTTRTAGAGTLTHIANGRWCYVPTQAETNYDAFAIDFYHASAVGQGALVEVVTADQGIALITADTSAIKAKTDAYLDATISSRLAASGYTAPDNASIAAIKTQTDKLQFDASNYVYATGLGGGGGVQVVVQPLTASVQRTDGAGGVISGWTYARLVASWNVKDVDLSGHDLRLILFDRLNPDTAIAEYGTVAGEIAVTYTAPDSLIEVDGADGKTPNAGSYAYVLRDQTTDTVLLSGNCLIQAAPDAG